ncbi:MAG: cytochrome c, partial [Planctomycetota bacterium]
ANSWKTLISGQSLEDEIKRMRLQYTKYVANPGEFKGGGYQDASRELSIFGALFGIIGEYDGDVRWKKDAPLARDIFAQSSIDVEKASQTAFATAQRRAQDLTDLTSGSGIASNEKPEELDWSDDADRAYLMEYLEFLLNQQLKPNSNNAAAVKANKAGLLRNAELVAAIGHLLVQEEMDDYDDEDYAAYSELMKTAALEIVSALERDDADGIRKAVGKVDQSCSKCHEDFR